MAQVIARDEESEGDLIAWWEGDDIEPGDSISVGMNEVAVLLHGEDVMTSLGPGRHAVPAFEDELSVAFISAGLRTIEAQGVLEDYDDADLILLSALRVVDAVKMMPLLEKLDDEESLEDYLGDELLIHAAGAIEEADLPDTDAINASPANDLLLEQVRVRGTEVLSEYGITLERVDALKVE